MIPFAPAPHCRSATARWVARFCFALLTLITLPALAVDPLPALFVPSGNIDRDNQNVAIVPLLDGKMLVVGAYFAQTYDRTTNAWGPVANMLVQHMSPTAARLPDGRVLVVGTASTAAGARAAEVYDPATNTFSPTGNPVISRYAAKAVALNTGEILVVMGRRPGGTAAQVAEAELYNPVSGQFRLTGTATQARVWGAATLLNSGKVLVTGGSVLNSTIHKTAEVYDPATGQFRAVGQMTKPRQQHAAVVLRDGRVLIGGGYSFFSSSYRAIPDAEVFNPTTETFQAIPGMLYTRMDHTFNLLPDGRVLVAGGQNDYAYYPTAVEVFDPATNLFTEISARLITPRRLAGSLSLDNGQVLFVSGQNESGALLSAETFLPDRVFQSTFD